MTLKMVMLAMILVMSAWFWGNVPSGQWWGGAATTQLVEDVEGGQETVSITDYFGPLKYLRIGWDFSGTLVEGFTFNEDIFQGNPASVSIRIALILFCAGIGVTMFFAIASRFSSS